MPFGYGLALVWGGTGVSFLIREECNVNGVFAGHTALQAASQNGHLEVSIGSLLRFEFQLAHPIRSQTLATALVSMH